MQPARVGAHRGRRPHVGDHAPREHNRKPAQHQHVPGDPHPGRHAPEPRPAPGTPPAFGEPRDRKTKAVRGLKGRRLKLRRRDAPSRALRGEKRVPELPSSRKARRGIELRRPNDHGPQRLRHPGRGKARLAVRRPRLATGHAEEQHHSQRKDVARHAGLPKAKLLGRGVGARAKVRGVLLGARPVGPRDPQVDEGDAAL